MTRMERRRRRRRILRIKLATTAAVLALTTASIVALTGGAAETVPEQTPQPPALQAEPVLLVAEHDSTYQPVQMTAEPAQEPEPVEEEDENEKIEAALLEQGYLHEEIPLDFDLQCHLITVCEEYGVPQSVALGVYGRETTDQADEDIPPANRYINVAFVAKWLNYESGSETTAFKQLASVYPSKLTSTEMKALADKSLNYFITVGSKNLSMNGKVIGNEWADIIRFRDWLKNDMQLRVVNLFVTRPKVPYTDAGISLVQNQMIASLKSGQDAGGIAESEFDEDGTEIPGYVTSVPLAASLSASEKASRKLTKCKFKARLAGAIHFAELKGSLTYEL